MKIKKEKIERLPGGPELPPAFSFSEIVGSLVEDEVYISYGLADSDLSYRQVKCVTFEQCLLESAILSGSELEKIQLTDVRLKGCDFANACWREAYFRRVDIVNSRLLGFLSNESEFQDVTFRDCNLSLAQFRYSKFKYARFENCILTDADFSGSDLSGVRFEKCDLSRAKLSGSKCRDMDLRGSQIDGLVIGLADLRGAIIEPIQAVPLIYLLGVQVKQ